MGKNPRKPLYRYEGIPISFVTVKELLPLALRIAKRLCDEVKADPSSLEPVVFDQTFFADRELMSRKPIDAYLRETRVIYLDCPRFPTVNDGIMNTLFTLEAIAAGGVRGITHVMTYAPYMRQDKRKPGEPLSWSIVMDMIKHSADPLDRLVALELHTEQHEQAIAGGTKKLKLDHIRGHRIFAEHLAPEYRAHAAESIVVSPDATGAGRAKKFRDKLFPETGELKVGYFEKERVRDNVASTLSYTGPSPKGKIVFIYDDMVDTGGSIANAIDYLYLHGAKKVVAVAMHALLNGEAVDKFRTRNATLVASESIPRSEEWLLANKSWFTQVPLDEWIARVILEQRPGGSVSQLFI